MPENEIIGDWVLVVLATCREANLSKLGSNHRIAAAKDRRIGVWFSFDAGDSHSVLRVRLVGLKHFARCHRILLAHQNAEQGVHGGQRWVLVPNRDGLDRHRKGQR